MNNPELRFNNDKHDWEKKQIKDCANFLSGKGLSKSDITEDGENECILYGHLYTDYGMIATKINHKTNNIPDNVVYSKNGDVLIPGSDTTPTGLARATSVEKDNVILGSDINIIRPNNNENGSFLSLAINKNKDELIKLIKGTTVRHIHNSDIKDVSISVPNDINVEENIVDLIKFIDQRIEMEEIKLKKLKQVKEAMLTKMLPSGGGNKPLIRFDGFSGDWIEKEIKEIAVVKMCKRIFKEQTTSKGEIPFFKIGTFGGEPDAFISKELFESYKTKFPYPKIGNILISASGTIGRIVEYKGNQEYFQDSNIIWLEHNELLLDKYLKYYIQIINWNIEGSTIQRLYNSNILTTTIKLPPTLEEQEKIGEYFEKLDEKINLEATKLNKLKDIKNAMLNKLLS